MRSLSAITRSARSDVGKVRAGFTRAVRAIVFERFQGLETKTCPFKNLPDARRGQWAKD
jgi:hypothetical protein